MKLLICDDDISMVDVIQNQLNCQELGITRILRAYNGEAAKKIILEEKPELVLCDIGMPKCNGIEVLKFIRANQLDTEFAFLTCYESFEFAREAVRYGATNYLSKPLDFDELKTALFEMIAAARKKQRPIVSKEDESLVDNRINSLLRQISSGFFGTDRDRINSVLRRSRVEFDADSRWRITACMCDMTDALRSGWNRELLLFSFERLVEEALTGHIGSAYTLLSIGERFVTALCFVDADKCSESELLQRCRKLVQLAETNIGIRPGCVVGEVTPLYLSPRIIPSLNSTSRKLRLQPGAVAAAREISDNQNTPACTLDTQQVLFSLKTQDRKHYQEMITAALDKIVHNRGGADVMMEQLLRDIRQTFISCLQDNQLSHRDLFENPQLRSLESKATRSPEDMELFSMAMFDRTLELLHELAGSVDIIAGVKSYILEHYQEDIDRDTIAAMAYITPNYLSKRFRTEMGMNLREYINQLRIEEAKRLLLTTNDAISEIASKVGYTNISYFSTVFRKQCGMSPIDWRSNAGEGAEG